MKYLTITSPRGNLPPEIAGGVFQAGIEGEKVDEDHRY